jgi:hypothetical protein
MRRWFAPVDEDGVLAAIDAYGKATTFEIGDWLLQHSTARWHPAHGNLLRCLEGLRASGRIALGWDSERQRYLWRRWFS